MFSRQTLCPLYEYVCIVLAEFRYMEVDFLVPWQCNKKHDNLYRMHVSFTSRIQLHNNRDEIIFYLQPSQTTINRVAAKAISGGRWQWGGERSCLQDPERRQANKMDSLPMSMDRDSLQQLLGEIETVLLDCDGELTIYVSRLDASHNPEASCLWMKPSTSSDATETE